MTTRQVELVRDSFESIRELSGPLSQLFYGRLFTVDPRLRLLFRNDIRLQGEKLMAMIAAVVDSAGTLDVMRPELRELGRKHLAYGARPADYDAVASALLWSLGQALEQRFDREVREAWSALMTEVNEEMKKGAAEA
jgi:hemoglobin-like flavoprotein